MADMIAQKLSGPRRRAQKGPVSASAWT